MLLYQAGPFGPLLRSGFRRAPQFKQARQLIPLLLQGLIAAALEYPHAVAHAVPFI